MYLLYLVRAKYPAFAHSQSELSVLLCRLYSTRTAATAASHASPSPSRVVRMPLLLHTRIGRNSSTSYCAQNHAYSSPTCVRWHCNAAVAAVPLRDKHYIIAPLSSLLDNGMAPPSLSGEAPELIFHHAEELHLFNPIKQYRIRRNRERRQRRRRERRERNLRLLCLAVRGC